MKIVFICKDFGQLDSSERVWLNSLSAMFGSIPYLNINIEQSQTIPDLTKYDWVIISKQINKQQIILN